MRGSLPVFRIAAIGAVIAGVLVWLAWPTQAFAQPPIPHPVEGREDCLACHATGVAGAPKVPDDHAGRTNDMCRGCHVVAMSTPAPSIPHPLEGHEECVACHSPAPAGAQPTAAPPPLPTPLAHPQAQGEANSCRDCHESLGGASAQIVSDWESSIHAERQVSCADCHGGDPNAADRAEAMSPDAGFIGKPDRTEIPNICGSCHSDVTMMRQYNLPTDELSQYQQSVHGQRLAQGDTKVAVCSDCHDGHATHEPNDPRASVYLLNVPDLCARCHADEEYMAGYDIPTNQYALYKESVHGVALLQNQDTRAPNCATCHGTHGAAPPGFTEVSNVCGSCHSATQDYYLKGAHSSNDPNAPRCVTCHGRYDVSEPSEAMFLGNEPRHCGSCHAADSAVGGAVTGLYQSLVSADDALNQADSAVQRAAGLGMIVAEEEGLLADARTKLITARAAQHMVDLDTSKQASDESIALSDKARQQAEDAVAQSVFRREAMVIALGVIVLVILSLVLLRRELIARRSRS